MRSLKGGAADPQWRPFAWPKVGGGRLPKGQISQISAVPSLFWPINTAQSYNLAQHFNSLTAMTFATADTLPAGVSLSSAGVISGTATESIAGFAVLNVTNAAGSTLNVPIYLAITDVPDAYTSNMWGLTPVLDGLLVDVSQPVDMNSAAFVKRQYSTDAGTTALDLPADAIIPTTVARDVVIRDVNAIGPGAWSDSKNAAPELTAPPSYPAVRNTAAQNGGSANSSAGFTISAHSGRVVGDTLEVVLAIDGNATATLANPGDWGTAVRDDQGAGGSGTQRAFIYTRTADGTSADDFVVSSLSASENWAARKTCYEGAVTIVVSAPHNVSGTSVTPNAPNLDLGSVKDARWEILTVYGGGSGSITSANVPSGYIWGGNTLSQDTSAGVGIAMAYREAQAQSENPAAWGQTTQQPITYTKGVYKSLSAPVLATDLDDQTFEQNTGGGVVEIASSFTGTGITYTVSGGPTGTTIDEETGIVTIPTTTAGTSTVTVTATNGAGSANDSFGVTITAAPIEMATFTLASGIDDSYGVETAGWDFVDAGGAPTQRLVAQSVTGRWHVIGDAGNPVRVTFRRPFVVEDGYRRYWGANKTTGTVAAGTARRRNGAMLNPFSLRKGAPGQGFDNYYYDPNQLIDYVDALNVNTGSPLSVSGGMIVQAVSTQLTNPAPIEQTGTEDKFGTRIAGHASFAVIPSAPPVNFFAIPPAGADKTLFFGLHAGMLHMDKLRSLDMSALPDQRSFKSIAQETARLRNTWSIQNDKSRNMFANDQRTSPYGIGKIEDHYSRDNMPVWGRALIAAHRAPNESDPNNTTAWKNQMVYNICQYGIDVLALLANNYDIASQSGAGGGYEVGFGAIAGFTAALFDLDWMKALCAPNRTKPNGTPKYRNGVDSSKGTVGYGLAESNQYAYIDSTYVAQTSMYYFSGRPYPRPYQTGHIGIPDMCSGRITIEGSIWHTMPNWDGTYKENRMSEVGPFVGAYLIDGMDAILGMAVAIQYFDRAIVAHDLGKMRSEAGLTDLGKAAFNTYRALFGVPVLNIQPDQPDPPKVTAFVGSGDRIGLRRSSTNLDHGSPILGSKIWYRTTTPPRYETDDGGWTGPIDVAVAGGLSKDVDTFVTGLSPSTYYWFTFCDYNANGDGPRSTNLRKTVNLETASDGLTAPRGVGTTSTNQTISNTTPPSVIGGTAVGDEIYLEYGVWAVEPTSATVTWKRDGSAVGTGRKYTRQAGDVGHTLTWDATFSNSSSSLPLSGSVAATVASMTRAVNVIGATTKFDTTSGSGTTRTLNLTATQNMPASPLVLAALMQLSGTATSIGTLNAVLRDAASVAKSSTSGTNELTSFASTEVSGNERAATKAFVVPQTADGATKVTVATNLNGNAVTSWAMGMAALLLPGYDVANARYGGTSETIADSDLDICTAEATVGISQSGSGAEQVVPKGSLVIAVMASGRHYGALGPNWPADMTPITGASGFAKAGAGGQSATVGIAYKVTTEAGPVTVTCDIAGSPTKYAMSVIAIPPA